MYRNSNSLSTQLMRQISWLTAPGHVPAARVVTFVKVAKRIKHTSA
jgi:hypothetical protein